MNLNEVDDNDYDENDDETFNTPAPTTPEQPKEPEKDETKGASHLVYTSAIALAALAATVMWAKFSIKNRLSLLVVDKDLSEFNRKHELS